MNKSLGYYGLRYVGLMMLIMVLVAAFVYAAYAFAPDLANRFLAGNSGTSVVTAIVPALMIGQIFYRQEQRKMTRGEGWSMALIFTVLAFLVSGAVFWASLQFGILDASAMRELKSLWANGRDILVYVSAGLFVFYVLINRLMLWSGVRGASKQAEKLAAKAARNG